MPHRWLHNSAVSPELQGCGIRCWACILLYWCSSSTVQNRLNVFVLQPHLKLFLLPVRCDDHARAHYAGAAEFPRQLSLKTCGLHARTVLMLQNFQISATTLYQDGLWEWTSENYAHWGLVFPCWCTPCRPSPATWQSFRGLAYVVHPTCWSGMDVASRYVDCSSTMHTATWWSLQNTAKAASA